MRELKAFKVPGKPQGKARPRINTSTHAAYTPKKTKEYEELVRWSYLSQYKATPEADEPIRLEIWAYYPIPKGLSKQKRRELLEGHYSTKKPDADNIAKAIADALNGVAYKDDSCIAELKVIKLLTEEEPSVMVYIESLEQGGRL